MKNYSIKYFYFWLNESLYVCERVCAHMYSCLWGPPEENAGSPGDGIIDNCELSGMGSGNWIQIHPKSRIS